MTDPGTVLASAEDRALRRVRPLHVVTDPKVEGGRRASSAAFDDDPDGSSMSVYLRSLVLGLGRTETDVVSGKPSGWGVASIPLGVLDREEQTVEPDPIHDAAVPHPCDPAHALVHGIKKPKGRRERISRKSPLVYVVA